MNKKKLQEMNCLVKVYKEIAINKGIEHPHIIRLYDYFETDTDIYLVFEHASGGELFEQISNRRINTEDMARKYFQQLISAVDFVHKNGVAHRDLKPENILLDQNGNIKVLDFGFANLIKDGRCLRTSCGSPNYAAPEVILSKPYDGELSDVWSCGVILYSMIEGTLPFDNGNLCTLFKIIEQGKFRFQKTVSTECKDLINRMLQPNTLKRITVEEIKAHPWFKPDLNSYLFDHNLLYGNIDKKEIDEEIFKQILNLGFNINPKDEHRLKRAILKKDNIDFCAAYNELNHTKILSSIDKKLTTAKDKIFTKKKLKKETIHELNQIFSNFSTLTEFRPVSNQEESNRISSYSSMKTNETIAPGLNKSTCENQKITEGGTINTEKIQLAFHSGVSFKMSYNKMIELVFSTLKEMKMIWK